MITLPPDKIQHSTADAQHGTFELILSAPVWTSSTAREISEATIRFWGHSSSHEQAIAIPKQNRETKALVPITVGPAEFISYLKEVYALHIIFSHSSKHVASCTFPLVQIGPSELNSNHEGTIPLLSDGSSQCIGHVHLIVKVSFPDLEAFQELECHVSNTTPDFQCLRDSVDCGKLSGELQRDAVYSHADALLHTLFERLRSKKSQSKEEDVQAQHADVFALIHAVCIRRPNRVKKAFKECDQNKSGRLDSDDLVTLAEEILPFVPSKEQLSFFRLMLDPSGASEFTVHEVQTGVTECKDIINNVNNSTGQESGKALYSCACALQQRSLELGKRFRSLDEGRTGELPIGIVLDIIQELTDSPQSIRRCIIAKQHAICRCRVELLSLEDIRHLCRQIIEQHSSSSVQRRPINIPACRQHSLGRTEDDKLYSDGPQCGGVLPQSDGNVGSGSSERSPQSPEGTLFAKNSPDQLSAQQDRRACLARESLEQFEAQYSEIQRMLALNPRRPAAGRRRSDSGKHAADSDSKDHDTLPLPEISTQDVMENVNVAEKPLQMAHEYHQEANCATAQLYRKGAIDLGQAADCLLAKALNLRDLVMELSSSVSKSTSTALVGQCESTMGNSAASARQTQAVHHGQSQTGHSRVQDAVELASMKALACTSSTQQILQQCQGDLGREPHGVDHAATAPGENDTSISNIPNERPHELASCGIEARLKSTEVKDQRVQSPVSDEGEVHTLGELQVSHVQNIVLSSSARAMLDGPQQLGVWLAWRLPGVTSTRPCCHLMHVYTKEVLPQENGSYMLAGKNVNMRVQVPLSLSRLRAATTLGQPACLQCELWLLSGEDSAHALSQAQLSLLIGLCSIPLQFFSPKSGVVVLSQGYHTLPNVLEGWDGARLEVQLTAGEDAAGELESFLPSKSYSPTESPQHTIAMPQAPFTSARLDVDPQESGVTQGASTLIHHAFEVHMIAMNDLPSPRCTGMAAGPVARYLKYSFPCDSQALYTQDVPVQACTVFEEATFAQHKIVLPDGTTILQHLREQSPHESDEPSLCFEVFECYDDGNEGEDQVCFIGKLPLKSLLQSLEFDVAEGGTGKRRSSPVIAGRSCQRSFVVQLTDVLPGAQLSMMDAKPYISVRAAYTAE